jgi:hypothetical protein
MRYRSLLGYEGRKTAEIAVVPTDGVPIIMLLNCQCNYPENGVHV